MNTYINKRTGAVIQTASECSGGDWVLQKEPQQPAEKPKRRGKGANDK